MRIQFTKMQGAGNDFVVLDETRGLLGLNRAQYQFLGHRRWGVGADQILSVRPSPAPGIDFAYAIHNADGAEVEHCGNGARCFLSFVRQTGLTDKTVVTVQTLNRVLTLHWLADGQVTVDMQTPVFDLDAVPFNPAGLVPKPTQASQHFEAWQTWLLPVVDPASGKTLDAAVLSMGNPHAVLQVPDAEAADVLALGPKVQALAAFAEGVNVGFMQVQSRARIHLRVYERGAGETLACGTGACAAVVCGIRLGLLDDTVAVQTHGGVLTVHWAGGAAPVLLTGPATTVFSGEIDLPDHLTTPLN